MSIVERLGGFWWCKCTKKIRNSKLVQRKHYIILVIIYLLTLPLCHSERSEESRYHKVGVTEILPPFGRLNDKWCQQVYCSLICLFMTIFSQLNALTLVSLANGESILLFFKEPSFQLGFPFACVMKPRTFAPSVTTCRINMQH